MTQIITVNSHRHGKGTPVEVVVTRVTVREVSYIAVDSMNTALVAFAQ